MGIHTDLATKEKKVLKMAFEKRVFKILEKTTELKKEKFEVSEQGFKRGFDTFLLVPTMAIYRTHATTEILPMARSMEWILVQYKKSKKQNL